MSAIVSSQGTLIKKNLLLEKIQESGQRPEKFLAQYRRSYRDPFTTKISKINDVRSYMSPADQKRWREAADVKTRGEIRAESEYLIFPRMAAVQLQKLGIVLENKLSVGEDIHCQVVGSLRPHQQKIICHLLENIFCRARWEAGTASTLLKLRAGLGKTYIALHLVRIFQKKTLIVVPNKYLLNQWKETIATYLSNISVGEYHGVRKVDGDIVVAVINSVIGSDFQFAGGPQLKSSQFFAQFGFVVFDEVHKYCGTGKFKNSLRQCQCRFAIGLSATPLTRSDGFDIASSWYLGDILDPEDVGIELVNTSFNVRVSAVKYYAPSQHCSHILNPNTSMLDIFAMAKQFAKDPSRCQYIVDECRRLISEGKSVYIFTTLRSIVVFIAKLLEQNNFSVEAPEIVSLMGGASRENIHAAASARIIITTYKYTGTGVSIPSMNAIIFMSPQKADMIQITRRICRLGSDTSIEREIIDIIDWNTCVKKQSYARKKIYIAEFGDDLKIDEKVVKAKDIAVSRELKDFVDAYSFEED